MHSNFSKNLFLATFASAFMAFFSFQVQAQTIIPIDPEWPPIITEPFKFMGPDTTDLAFAPSSPVLIKWQGGTSTQRVQVKFSANNGENFPFLLAAGVPASQREVMVVMPNINTQLGRFQLRLTATGDSTRTDVSTNPVVLSSSLVCQPVYMFAEGAFISSVRITGPTGATLLNSPSTYFISSGFVDYSGSVPVPNLTRSSSTSSPQFTIETLVAGPNAGAPKNVAIWIDYNNDNTFASTGPEFLGTFSATTGTTFRRTFSIPSTVSTGFKRLRVRMVNNTMYNIPASSACAVSFQGLTPTATTSQGETEDYAINVVSGVSTGRFAPESQLDENQEVSSMLFPNPVSGSDLPQLMLQGMKDQIVSIQLSDLQGRQLMTTTTTPDADQFSISLSQKPARGIYLIQVMSPGGLQIHRMVVE